MPRGKAIILTVLSVLFTAVVAMAQEQTDDSDSLIRLDYAKTAELIEINGQNYRKVIGPAEFMHNDTFMLCDTALWNIDTQVIDAVGNVSLIQEGTVLTSHSMVYYIDDNLAQFRGHLVQLVDSDLNTLRTSNLDYNTKDSVAVFDEGGSMRDKDGQLIESIKGTYDAKAKLFTFTDDVNMFTDSIFVKTTYLEYQSDISTATFGRETDAWKEENMLSADAGWYDRDREIFFFRNNVHVMNDTQEGWSDSLYFWRNTMDVEMLGRAQVTDTSRNVTAVAGRITYVDSISTVTLLRDPAIIARTEQDDKVDTVYFGADTIVYYTLKMCDVDSIVVVNSRSRLEELDVDPVGTYRQQAAEEARKRQEESLKNDPNYRPDAPMGSGMADMGAGAAGMDEGEGAEGAGQADEGGGPGAVQAGSGGGPEAARGGTADMEEGGTADEGGEGVDLDEGMEDGAETGIGEADEEEEGSEGAEDNMTALGGGEDEDAGVAGPGGENVNPDEGTEENIENEGTEEGGEGVDIDEGTEEGAETGIGEGIEEEEGSGAAGSGGEVENMDERGEGGIEDEGDGSVAEGSGLPPKGRNLRHGRDSLGTGRDSLGTGLDSLGTGRDSLGFGADSLGTAADSLAGPLDTTKVGFVWAVGKVKLYKEDMQMVCDSLEYCDLDSLVRMYKGSMIWNEITQQYSADSITAVVKDGRFQKASLMSNSFIVIEEEPDTYYDQIKSVEGLAFFDSTGVLSRFDALGSATGFFFLREEDVVATANRTESKMISALFEDGSINMVYYFQEVENDAYPVVQLPKEDQKFKGFNWQPELRPDSPQAVTTVTPHEPMRQRYKARPRAAFNQTELYFPGYIPGIYREIAARDSLERVRARQRQMAEELSQQMLADSLARDSLARADSLSALDSLGALGDSLAGADSLAALDTLPPLERLALNDSIDIAKNQKTLDSLELKRTLALSDSLYETIRVYTKEELKAKAQAEKEAERQRREALQKKRQEEKEAKWALKDTLDAQKAAAKQAKIDSKAREKKRRYLEKIAARNAVEDARLENYVKRITAQEDRLAAKGKPSKVEKQMSSGSSGGKAAMTKAERQAAKAQKKAQKKALKSGEGTEGTLEAGETAVGVSILEAVQSESAVEPQAPQMGPGSADTIFGVQRAEGEEFAPGELQFDEDGNVIPPEELQFDEDGNVIPPGELQFDEDGNPIPPEELDENGDGTSLKEIEEEEDDTPLDELDENGERTQDEIDAEQTAPPDEGEEGEEGEGE